MANCKLTVLAAQAILEEGDIHPIRITEDRAEFATAQGYIIEIRAGHNKFEYILHEKMK